MAAGDTPTNGRETAYMRPFKALKPLSNFFLIFVTRIRQSQVEPALLLGYDSHANLKDSFTLMFTVFAALKKDERVWNKL
jgi:hypothetical protein